MHIRAFTPRDYPAIAAVHNASCEDAAITAEQLSTQDEVARRHGKSIFQRYVVEQDGSIVASSCYDQPPRFYEPGTFRVMICVEPRYQRRGIGTALYARMSEDFHALNTRSIWVKIHADMLPGLRFARKYGLVEDLRVWELCLDTSAFDFHPYARLDADFHTQQIEIKTLQELEADTERYQKLYRLTCEVGQDLPSTERWAQPDYDDFVRETQLREHASYFVAIGNDTYVGLSYLTARAEKHACSTGLTGVTRAYRRKGIALALKLRGITYAREHGYTMLTTSVDSSNLASLSMNERIGFVKGQTWIVFARSLST